MLNTQDKQRIKINKDNFSGNHIRYDSHILLIISILFLVFHVITNIISISNVSYSKDEIFIFIYSLFGKKLVETTFPFFLEMITLFIFILAIKNMRIKRLNGETDYFAQWTQFVSLISLFSLAHRLLGFLEELIDFLSENRQYCVLVVSLIIIIFIVIAFIRYKKRVNKISILGNKDTFLNYLFICVVILNILGFLWYYGRLESLLGPLKNNMANEVFMLIVFLLSLIALLATLIHCKKKMKQIPLIMWIICSLCICGMAPVFQQIEKIEELFREHAQYITVITVIVALVFFFWNLNYRKSETY